MSDYLVRPVNADDYAQWLPLWEGYNAFYGRHGETALPAAMVCTTWARFLDTSEPMHALVAERDGQLLGLAHYLFHRSTIQREPVCYLQDLFTAAPVRGLGVGRRLIEAVYAQARTANAQRVYWHTHETNTTAMKLYDSVAHKSGFIVYRAPV